MKVKEVLTGAHWGVFYAQVENDRVVGVRPFERDPNPSPMIDSIAGMVHSPVRIQQPAVRAGYLEKGPGKTSGRGAEPFVAVGWDQALDLVERELRRVTGEYGNESIFAGSYGWRSAGRFHWAQAQMHRFLNLLGGFSYSVGNYSTGAAMFLIPRVLGDLHIIFSPTSWASVERDTQLIVAFGGIPLKNTQTELGGVVTHDTPLWLERIRKSGTRFVCVGPIRDDMAADLEADWLPARPNTDTALMLALAHTLYTENLWDKDFVTRYCVGFEQFLPYLTGERDGQPKDAEWAAAICELAATEIRQLARRMASQRTMINVSFSIQRADHGEQPFWMAIVLAAMLGQIGLPGGGIAFGYGASAGSGVPRTPFSGPKFPTGANPVSAFIPVARIADALLYPGTVIDFDGQQVIYPDIRLLWWAGGNPFHHHQDINRLLKAWQQPETVIVNDTHWTPVARHADIVLPATTTLERNDIGGAVLTTDRHLFTMKQAIPACFQARNEYDMFRDLADRFGVEPLFSEGRDEMGWLEYLYEKSRESLAAKGFETPDFPTFWDRGVLEIPPPDEPLVALQEFRKDPLAHPLKTPSGKVEIFSQTIQGFGYPDCAGHPVWREPAEWLGAPLAKRFPLHLVSNQPDTRLHSQLDQGRVSQASKVAGREPIRMHPTDAARRNLRHGDVVRVFNDRGACLAGLLLCESVRPGVVQLATGAWYDPQEPGVVGSMDRHGNPNVLTLDKGSSRLAQAPVSHTTLVEVEKFSGSLEPVGIFQPPPIHHQ